MAEEGEDTLGCRGPLRELLAPQILAVAVAAEETTLRVKAEPVTAAQAL